MAMNDRRFDRRRFMRNAGLAMAAAAAGKTLLPRVIAPARASGSDNIVRVLGVSTGAPDSWSEFEQATGLKVEWTPIGDDVGLFLHEMIGNDGGERYDLVTSLSGTYEVLADQHLLMPVDTAKLKNWSGVSDLIRNATPQAPGGKGAWSVPFQFNADSFAYFPKALGEPDAPAEVSWSLIYDDKRTLGKSAIDNGVYALLCCALYLKHHGLVQIGDIANLTASEAASVSNYLIERKKAGQFRTLYKSYDEQVELLESHEVLATSCWEPAAMDARGKGLDVAYAFTVEGYDKWSQNLMIPAQVRDRGASDKVHALIDWFMGGAYAAEKSATQGYLTPRPDLGMAYAQEKGWDPARLGEIRNAIQKLDRKFLKPLFWDPGYFKNMEIYEREVARFKNA